VDADDVAEHLAAVRAVAALDADAGPQRAALLQRDLSGIARACEERAPRRIDQRRGRAASLACGALDPESARPRRAFRLVEAQAQGARLDHDVAIALVCAQRLVHP